MRRLSVVGGSLSVVKLKSATALDEGHLRDNVTTRGEMAGAVITFLCVCAIVAVFMTVAHQFLRAAEEPEDIAREEKIRELARRENVTTQDSPRPQWAH